MRPLPLLAALLAALPGLGALLAAPGQAVPPGQLLALGRALGAAAAALLACLGAGSLLLRRRAGLLRDELGAVHALLAGFGLWGLLSLPWALVFGVSPRSGAGLLLLLAASWLARPPLPRLRAAAWPALLAAPWLLLLLAPVVDVDELYRHLALPRNLLLHGHLLSGPLHPNASRPLAVHLPWTWLLGLGGPGAPRALALALAATLLLALHARARSWWGPAAGALAPLLLLGSTSFLRELGLAYDDLPAALAAWAALDLLLLGELEAAGWAAGVALAAKYTAALAVLPPFLFLLLVPGRQLSRRRLLLAGGLALLPVLPWWLRNLADGLHPLFPYAGWPPVEGGLRFQYPEKYGLGREPLDFLLLPWRASVEAAPRGAFLGRLNPAFLGLLPAALLGAPRDRRLRLLLATSLLGAAGWAAGPQVLRYFLPLLPALALAAAGGLSALPRPLRVLGWLAWGLGLPANLYPPARDALDRLPAALGWEGREDFLQRELPAWPALRWIERETPRDAGVALLFAWQAWPLDRPWLLGSLEDHVPSRHLLLSRGDDALCTLVRAGARYALVQRVRFLRAAYPFLAPEELERSFREPRERLDRLLLAQASLLYQDGLYAVWKLPDGCPAGPEGR